MSMAESCANLDEVDDGLSDEITQLLLSLPKDVSFGGAQIYQYKGFWWRPELLYGTICSQRHFQAHDNDIILASYPKSGTTWLKAFTYSIVHRHKFPIHQSPLLNIAPHDLVPFIEVEYNSNKPNLPKFERLCFPRILGTHIPYSLLPNSILNSKCRTVYICRNPLDQFISHWQFSLRLPQDEKFRSLSLEDAFDKVCNGIQAYGPSLEHNLEYWKGSLNDSEKILVLKYEDVKNDTSFYVKKLASFLGFPFSEYEKNQGIVEEIIRLCSFEKLRDLEINKMDFKESSYIPNSHFFRKGEVGDWKNYLTPSMAQRFKKIIEDKISGSGFAFQMLEC